MHVNISCKFVNKNYKTQTGCLGTHLLRMRSLGHCYNATARNVKNWSKQFTHRITHRTWPHRLSQIIP